MPNAGAVGNMQIDGAVIIGSKYRGERARAERKSASDPFGVGLHAAKKAGVLIEERKKHSCQRNRNQQVPGPRGKRGQPAQAENGADQREASHERSNPPTGRIGMQILGQQRGSAEGNEVEFDDQASFFPKAMTVGPLKPGQRGGQHKKGANRDREIAVTVAEHMKLVRTI